MLEQNLKEIRVGLKEASRDEGVELTSKEIDIWAKTGELSHLETPDHRGLLAIWCKKLFDRLLGRL
jgi:hypothetical protein